jgi:predicted GNAT family acetyltransferase
MDNIQLSLNEKGRGLFYLSEGEEQLGKMEIGISDDKLTVYHTEVSPKAEGKGLAKLMLSSMVAYAREHGLKVIPLCPFVYAQFKRHPEAYADLWTPQ